LFEQLAKKMKWGRNHNYQMRKIQGIKKESEKVDYVKEMCEWNEYNYDFGKDFYENFENLSDYLGWRTHDKRKKDFNKLVGCLAERIFNS